MKLPLLITAVGVVVSMNVHAASLEECGPAEQVPFQSTPTDLDGDGVQDHVDTCPESSKGATVNKQGCAVFRGNLEGVGFEVGSAKLTRKARTILNEAAAELSQQQYSGTLILIAAYADEQGWALKNQTLSEKRANTVKQYLVKKGVDPRMLHASGFGEAGALASNKTKACRTHNRRVEFSVIE